MAVRKSIPIGTVFTRLTVIGEVEFNGRFFGQLCQCACGTTKHFRRTHLIRNLIKSCGCYARDINRARKKKHGHNTGAGPSRTYESWAKMISRCTNPASISYKNYGGRGIKVCERWHTFENFLADMGERPVGTSLDRINNNENYGKENCRWATPKQQMRNRRNTRKVLYRGKHMTMSELAEMSGVKYHTLKFRLNAGWDIEHAMIPPLKDCASR